MQLDPVAISGLPGLDSVVLAEVLESEAGGHGRDRLPQRAIGRQRVLFDFAKLRIEDPKCVAVANGQTTAVDLASKHVWRKEGHGAGFDDRFFHQSKTALFPEIRLHA